MSLCVTRKRRCLFLLFLYSIKKVVIDNVDDGLRKRGVVVRTYLSVRMRLTEKRLTEKRQAISLVRRLSLFD